MLWKCNWLLFQQVPKARLQFDYGEEYILYTYISFSRWSIYILTNDYDVLKPKRRVSIYYTLVATVSGASTQISDLENHTHPHASIFIISLLYPLYRDIRRPEVFFTASSRLALLSCAPLFIVSRLKQ